MVQLQGVSSTTKLLISMRPQALKNQTKHTCGQYYMYASNLYSIPVTKTKYVPHIEACIYQQGATFIPVLE